MTHVLVLTTESLPYADMPTTGAGLRAWGLAEGLRSAGLKLTLAMASDAVEGKTIRDSRFSQETNLFHRRDLTDFVNRIAPDVIVFQHWGLMKNLQAASCPIALDLAGPHLLERCFWNGGDKQNYPAQYENDLVEKLDALRRADFVTCSGKFQRLYFLPFLAMAGYPIAKDTLPVIPFSVAPDFPQGVEGPRDPETFVYGGMFLPWQNPEKALELLLECFDQCGKGKLLFYGGPHPTMDVSRGQFNRLIQKLSSHKRVKMSGILPFDKLCKEYVQAGVALDLLEKNPERELAFTTRTLVYMWCGLPVIYNNYSELSMYIEGSGAGWTLDPSDEKSFKKIVRDILEGKINMEEKRAAARRLVREQFDWTKTISPLAEFCLSPSYREGKTGAKLAFETRTLKIQELEKDLEQTRSELQTLKGKLWFRLYQKSNILRWILSPFVFLFTFILSLFFLLAILLSELLHQKTR